MAALASNYMVVLRAILDSRFVPYLPPLLGNPNPADRKTKQLSRAFSAFSLHKILGLTPDIAAGAVVDDFQDKGIDAVYYDASKETLYLVQAKLKESEQFKLEDSLAFCDGIRGLLRQDFSDFNINIQNRQTEIESALDNCSHIQLVVPYTGDGVSKPAHDALQDLLDDVDLDDERLVKHVRYYAADDIVTDLLAEQAYRPVNVDIGLHKYEKIEEPRITYYGIARLSELVAMHHAHGKALYERNIRYFLGSVKSEVNKAIKSTLDASPEDFFYLNNGVTAICDVIEPKATRNGVKKVKIRGLSIINGAQTVASAAEFVSQYPGKDITNAKVMLTLIKASSTGTFGKQVTKARNHQNPVQVANFASLDENQERLRQEMAHLGFEYHYRPEATVSTPFAKVVLLEEALRALALLQDDPRYPVWLRSDLSRLNNADSVEYKALFPATLAGVKLVNVVLCYRSIRLVLQANENRARGQEKLVYRHGSNVIVAAMLKRLRTKIDRPSVLLPAEISALISRPFDQLRQDAFDLSLNHLLGVGPLAFFRNQGNVVNFLADLMEKNYVLGVDPAITSLRNVFNATDAYPRKRLIDYLSSHAPQI